MFQIGLEFKVSVNRVRVMVRVMVRVRVSLRVSRVSATMVTVRMGRGAVENSACRVYLSVPDGK